MVRTVAALACASSVATAPPQTIWDAAKQPHSNVLELRCRGGAGFEFRSLGVQAPANGFGMRVALALVFAPAARAGGAKGEGLDPGTCGWTTRPLAADEPREVHFIAPAYLQAGARPLDLSSTAAENYPDVHAIADYLKFPTHYWSFRAYDTGQGYLDSTTHGHWRDVSARAAAPEETPPPGVGPWRITVSTSGGMAGGGPSVTAAADGQLTATDRRAGVKCSARLQKPDLLKIESAIARAHPETWRDAYVLKSNPNGCCDQIHAGIDLEQTPSSGPAITRHTSWYSASAQLVPEGVTALSDLVWSLRNACAVQR